MTHSSSISSLEIPRAPFPSLPNRPAWATQDILPGAEPFSVGTGSVGCLLVHGFTSTAYDVRACADFLAARGIATEGVLLAGHGTTPADLAKTRLPDWLDSVRDATARLRSRASHIFALGISLGGNFLVSLQQELQFDGLILVGMPLHMRHARSYRMLYYAYRALGKQYQRKWYQWSLDPNIRRVRPNYRKIPIACLRDAMLAIELSHQALPAVRCPVLIIQSTTDHALDEASMTELRARLGSSAVDVRWIPDRYHVVLIDHGKEEVFADIERFIARHPSSP